MVETADTLALTHAEEVRAPSFSALTQGTQLHRRSLLQLLAAGALSRVMSTARAGESIAPTANTLHSGHLMFAGGEELPPEALAKFVELAGGDGARIVVVSTAHRDAEKPEKQREFVDAWLQFNKTLMMEILHVTPEEAQNPSLRKRLKGVNGFWFSGGEQPRLRRYVDGPLEEAMNETVQRGGIVGGISAGASMLCDDSIVGWEEVDGERCAKIEKGFKVFPGIADQHYLRNPERIHRLRKATREYGRYGIGVGDHAAALVNHLGDVSVLGKREVAKVWVCIPPSNQRPSREVVLKPGDTMNLHSDLPVARFELPKRPSNLTVAENGKE